MENEKLTVFEILKNVVQFFQIATVFFVMMLILHWIQHLTGHPWGWTAFAKPFLDCLVGLGEAVSDGHVMLFAAIFEFKYAIAVFILLLAHGFFRLVFYFIELLEQACEEGRIVIKKVKQKEMNKDLMATQVNEQQQIKNIIDTQKPKKKITQA